MLDPFTVLEKKIFLIYIYLDLLNKAEVGALPPNVQIRNAGWKKPPPITSTWLILIVEYCQNISNLKLEKVALYLNEKLK